ncbi:MAG TPA: hypothetical protein VF736_22005 [Pyrinomonadaceae bacterium]
MSRRRFLRSGAVCALATGVLLKSPLEALAHVGAGRAPGFDFTRAAFEPHLNTVFVAPGAGGGKVRLQLVGINGYEPCTRTRLTTSPHGRTETFSLRFRAEAPLRQSTHTHSIKHGALGRFDLFMTGSEEGGAPFYEAVINRVAS